MTTYRTFARGKEKSSLSEKYDKELKELEGKTRYDHK